MKICQRNIFLAVCYIVCLFFFFLNNLYLAWRSFLSFIITDVNYFTSRLDYCYMSSMGLRTLNPPEIASNCIVQNTPLNLCQILQ